MTETPAKPDVQGDGLENEREEALKSIEGDVLSVGESAELAEENEDELDFAFENAHLNFHIRLEKKRRREKWDNVLTFLVVAGFFFSYVVIILIGFHVMNFDNNAFAVPSVVAAGVVETYALAKLAIKYFFNDDDIIDK